MMTIIIRIIMMIMMMIMNVVMRLIRTKMGLVQMKLIALERSDICQK